MARVKRLPWRLSRVCSSRPGVGSPFWGWTSSTIRPGSSPRIGVQLQSSAYFDYLTLREILALLGTFYPKQLPPDALLEWVGLLDKASSRVGQLSGGQAQRFTLAASLINDPELVILDEPTTGLDPQSRRNLWALIREIRQRNVTVVLITHYMEEAAALCERLAIMDRGQLVAIDHTPETDRPTGGHLHR